MAKHFSASVKSPSDTTSGYPRKFATFANPPAWDLQSGRNSFSNLIKNSSNHSINIFFTWTQSLCISTQLLKILKIHLIPSFFLPALPFLLFYFFFSGHSKLFSWTFLSLWGEFSLDFASSTVLKRKKKEGRDGIPNSIFPLGAVLIKTQQGRLEMRLV